MGATARHDKAVERCMPARGGTNKKTLNSAGKFQNIVRKVPRIQQAGMQSPSPETREEYERDFWLQQEVPTLAAEL